MLSSLLKTKTVSSALHIYLGYVVSNIDFNNLILTSIGLFAIGYGAVEIVPEIYKLLKLLKSGLRSILNCALNLLSK